MAATAEDFIAGILEPFRTVLQAGVDRGEVDGKVSDLVSEVAGPLVLEHVVMGQRVTRRRGRAVVRHFLEHHLTATR